MVDIELKDKDKVKIFGKIAKLVIAELKTIRARRRDIEKLHNENPDDEAILGRHIEFENNGYSYFVYAIAKLVGIEHEGKSIIHNKEGKVYTGQIINEHFREKANRLVKGENLKGKGFLNEREVIVQLCLDKISEETGSSAREICRIIFNEYCAGTAHVSPAYSTANQLYETVKKRMQR